jgi:hypothetical protein
LAKTFGQLPSYVLANGTMFDISVANALAEFEKKAMDPNYKPAPNLNEEQMKEMLKRTREANAERGKKTK